MPFSPSLKKKQKTKKNLLRADKQEQLFNEHFFSPLWKLLIFKIYLKNIILATSGINGNMIKL